MSDVEVFDSRRCELGEGPLYAHRDGRVWWVDILGSRVLWRSADGAESGELSTSAHVGAAVPVCDGGFVACLPQGPVRLLPGGGEQRLPGYPGDTDGLRSNDAKADPAGRLWLGTMAYDERPGAGALYRLDPGAAALTTVFTGLTISNGLGWSPDGATMYHIDTPTGRIDAYDYDLDTGQPGARRTLTRVDEGHPDGMCVDAEGGVWVALWAGGAVRRYTPDGRLDRVVALPTPLVTSCVFAGPRLDTLVITTAAVGRPDDPHAGLVYAHQPVDVVGRPTDCFRG
ncbi:SMP-30/gluconolactonase/LRE family protein [Catellatospora paridis]|uniref:SMP-30/gluconolactonase/LRE family protein n=1 Tax=Catellatospora paridis TaxID=1617086 RepID=UPI0012D415CC|nr:SMP-30/gluconolactonase/LRE family protein [Catellatospora paridis]